MRGGRGRPGRNHDGMNGPHSMPRQGQGFMYQGHMGMQGMPSMPGIIVSQGMPSGPRGTPIGQVRLPPAARARSIRKDPYP